MKGFFSYTNELLLSLFLFSIIVGTTITTLALSPVVSTSAGNQTQILGSTNVPLLVSAADSSFALTENDTMFTLNDKLTPPLLKGVYERAFVVVENGSSTEKSFKVKANIPDEAKESLKISIKDAQGNTYTLEKGTRILTVPANSKQNFSIQYTVRDDINFNVDYSVVVDTKIS